MTAHIVQLFPELTNVNGDAENALVLTRRAQWAGLDADLVVIRAGESAPALTPAAVVLGSGVDSTLVRTREALQIIAAALLDWVGQGIPVLAVGTGLELLGTEIELEGDSLTGLGVVPARATRREARATGEMIVESRWGRLVGYENHSRGLVVADGTTPLGTLVSGVGNGDGTDGVQYASVFGTHLHGPVLAKNPALADEILRLDVDDRSDSTLLERADLLAERSNLAAIARAARGAGS